MAVILEPLARLRFGEFFGIEADRLQLAGALGLRLDPKNEMHARAAGVVLPAKLIEPGRIFQPRGMLAGEWPPLDVRIQVALIEQRHARFVLVQPRAGASDNVFKLCRVHNR